MAAPLPPEDILRDLGVTAPEFAAETGAALIWKVRKGAGHAALKLYKSGHMGNEAPGFRYLAALNGQAAARVHHAGKDVALTEWLDGPPLAALASEGRDGEMIAALAAVARRLHRDGPRDGNGFTPLDDFMAPLSGFAPPLSWSAGARADFAACERLGRDLLETQTGRRPLHGDLHPGNVIQAPRGLCAFDAKGLWGEPGFELANAFRHPRARPELVLSRDRIRRIAGVWAEALGCSPLRLLQWAAAKAALSLVWRSRQGLGADLDAGLIHLLLAEVQ